MSRDARENVVFTSIKSNLISGINQYHREIINVEKIFQFPAVSANIDEDLTYQVTTNLHQLTSNYYYCYNNKPKKDFNRINPSADEGAIDSTGWSSFDQASPCSDLSHDLLTQVKHDASDQQTPVQDDTGMETVDDIEKWLETCTDNSPAISIEEMDPIKCQQLEVVDTYLADELSHTFMEKDSMSIDIDLTDKKLSHSLGYDPILEELQSEKLLEVCEKDGFIMPEFQLDQLDPLTLDPNDMMVAGEILPSTSINNPSTTLAINGHQDIYSSEIKKVSGTDTDDISEKSSQVYDLHDKFSEDDEANVENIVDIINESDLNDYEEERDVNDDDGNVDIVEEVNILEDIEAANAVMIDTVDASLSNADDNMFKECKAISLLSECHKVPDKMEVGEVTEQIAGQEEQEQDQEKSKDEIMAVVAISTDKRSNMTQIVINTGKGEQIYRGKTSELMEATGYFSKSPKIKTNLSNVNTVKINRTEVSGSLSNQEAIISKALEDLGYSEENLVSVTLPDNGKMWICPREDCRREFNRLYALKGHILAHYGVRPFKCDQEGCTWAFHSEFKLKRHKETHLKRKDYVCQVEGCNKRFTTVYNLWTHEKLHTRPNRIACQVPECEEKFQTKRALELHMKTHDQSHAPYVCMHEGCGKRYYSSNALTSHQRCHSYKEVDIKCSWLGCGKIFDKPCRLKAHLRSHTGSKPYLCTFAGCSWAFTSSSKLKRHEKKHTNDRKFICDVTGCSKAFMRSEHLKEHKLTHSEGRYFQCYICEASFSAKSSLYVHIKKHQNKIAPEYAPENIQPLETKLTFSNGDNNFCHSLPMDLESEMINNDALQESFIGEKFVNSTSNGVIIDNKTVVNEIITAKPKFTCPIDNCTRTYMKKVSLKSHIVKFHGYCIEDSELGQSSETDYVLYANNTSVNNKVETTRRINVNADGDIDIVDTVTEISCLSEPKPPLTNEKLLKHVSNHVAEASNHGSARTGLTCVDILNMKRDKDELFDDSVIGASDVVLGTADLAESLLLPEELSSMYFHDDMGSECQILLLDSTTADSETTAY